MIWPGASVFSVVKNVWAWLSGTLPVLLKLPVCILATILLLIATWIVRPFDGRGARLRRFVVFWARTMLWICRIRLNTEGVADLDRSQQYVFVSNHTSWVDIPVLLAALPHDLAFLAKRELFQMWLVGACLRRTGQIAIDRSNTRGFADGLKKAAERLTRDHRSVLFFPAGTRVSSGAGGFKDGAAYFAIRAKLPVVPVGLTGTAAAMPRGSMRIHGGTVEVILGNPISTEDLSVTARGSLTKRLHEEVLSCIADSVAASPRDSRLGKPLGALN